MKILFKKYPIDIAICMTLSIILLPLSFLEIGGILRIILGLPFIVFIPGYLLLFVLFPTKKTDTRIGKTERFALSIGVSLAVFALIILAVNYQSGAYTIGSVFVPMFVYVCFMVVLSVYRWFNTPIDERFMMSFNFSFLMFKNKVKYKSKLDKTLLSIIIILAVTALILFAFIVSTPRTKEKFTDFYILGSDGSIISYPTNLSLGENSTVSIGIVNNEHEKVRYTVEIWLINQTILENSSTKLNDITYHNAWFIDKINVTLNHHNSDNDGSWEPQWEQNYTFNINRKGEEFRLDFLLFKGITKNYSHTTDYKKDIEENINHAYADLYLDIGII